MTTSPVFYAVLYSIIVGFAMSFGALYLVQLIVTLYHRLGWDQGRQERMVSACHMVEAHCIHRFTQGMIAPGVNRINSVEEHFRYSYKGKNYEYHYVGNTEHDSTIKLFFLENPASACLPEELIKGKFVWTRFVFPLGVLLSVVLFQYFLHWMNVVAAR